LPPQIASRGWFEDDAAFKARVQASKAAWMARMKAQSKKKKPAAASAGSAWANAPVRQKATTGTAKKTSAKPKASGGGVFAQMMMDSDSD
jgi:sRNA-binding protein